mmetsp:Transcript_59145/g.66157  ORF Transcript_59145/g.66157 Transcript_59145/m.66157 type:complete len:141 (-) Transcript_59145:1-423(-)
MSFFLDTKSWPYQKNCLLNPIQSSAISAILFSAIDVFQGTPIQRVMNPRSLGTYFGGVYLYHAIQCPMEAIHGRPSLWHNILCGGGIGYIGVSVGRLGIPFLPNPDLLSYRTGLPMNIVAFGVYGGLAGLFAGVLGNKRF